MSILQKLDLARFELLDMGLRGNPLLSVPRKRTAKFLDIVEERSADVFNILVENNQAMGFLPLPKDLSDKNESEDPDQFLPSLDEYLEKHVGDGRYSDLFLQTNLDSEKLDTRLLKINNEAHTLLNEQGIDVLYLSLGFLEWFEDKNSSTPRFAPLVLIPVELMRESARNRFNISYTGADLGSNLTLTAKLKGEFKVELPSFDEEVNISSYLQSVERSVTDFPNWKIHANKIGLGLFQFGKFQMYADLDPENWPEGSTGPNCVLLDKLFENGFQPDNSNMETIANHALTKAPEKLNLIKDTDSSQLEAVLAAIDGTNLVIQGPPGTGKSQTITNLIGEAIGRGKKVLFVAQKMAALEVVRNRLDECHLGDTVLELHSHKSNKSAVLNSLKTVFERGRPQTPDRSKDYKRLSSIREQLDEYVISVSEPILKSGLNFVDALGRMLELQTVRERGLQRIDFNLLSHWDAEDLDNGCRALNSIEGYLEEFDAPSNNPFYGTSLQTLSPSQENDLKELIFNAAEVFDLLIDSAVTLADKMRLSNPKTFSELELLFKACHKALNAPHLKGVALTARDWQLRRDEISELIECGRVMSHLRLELESKYIDAFFDADILSVRRGLVGRTDKWWRFFSSEFRRSKNTLTGFAKSRLDDNPNSWLEDVDCLLEYQKAAKRFKELGETGEALFGAQWQGACSDWEVLATLKTWIIELYDEIGNGELPQGIADFLQVASDLTPWQFPIEELESHNQKSKDFINKLVSALEWQDGLLEVDLIEKWSNRLTAWADTSLLYNAVRFNQLENLVTEAHLEPLLDSLRHWSFSPKALVPWLKFSYFSGLVDSAYSGQSQIGQFDRLTHERLIQDFTSLDLSSFSYSQEALVKKHYESLPSYNAPGEMDVLRREFSKKRRHIPIRKLLSEASHVIQQAKPVFMMSPMSVATYLPQGIIEFDLVIFDEASQIPAPEAIGSLMRGKQVVVVGDSKQMPPTNFFSKSVEIDDEDVEESVTADIESILGLMLARGAPEKMLRWHYRSRHHSLITVSNSQFYNNNLLVFPSSGICSDAVGLVHTHLPDTHYDRGGSRANIDEAKAIAEAVLEHVKIRPHLSLGVVAFSVAQRDMIMLEVERLRREFPESEEYFQQYDNTGDEFFIKNLENVQGDERDTIFISIGYGKTNAGKMTSSFGPLNKSGGERRLNVLISRARYSMNVFSNFTADDMRSDENSPFGVRALKAFLLYAKTGEMPVNQETDKEPDSPFEIEVKDAIEKLGYEVQPQIGSQGFFIDLAIRDPEKPGRYILAVECDGASYHSSATARDRDRLRQAVLEGLGWRFHRIWSTEWFRNRTSELDRLKQAIIGTIECQKGEDIVGDNAEPKSQVSFIGIHRSEPTPSNEVQIPKYQLVDLNSLGLPYVDDFKDVKEQSLQSAMIRTVNVEGPVNESVLTTRITHAAGLTRAGQRIQSRISSSLASLHESGQIEMKDGFASIPNKSVEIRDWSELPVAARKFDFVSTAEIQLAIVTTVNDAHSISKDDCMSAALALMGFKRLTDSIKKRLASIIDREIGSGAIAIKGEYLQKTCLTK